MVHCPLGTMERWRDKTKLEHKAVAPDEKFAVHEVPRHCDREYLYLYLLFSITRYRKGQSDPKTDIR